MKGVLPWACRSGTRDFYSALAAPISLVQNICFLTARFFTLFVPIAKHPGQAVVLGRLSLKGHGNKADFLGFLQKLVPHESLRLPLEPFRFQLRIRGDIRNRKTTPRLAESGSRQECL